MLPRAHHLLAAEVATWAQRLHTAGWVANHDGNVSVRLDDGTFLITPTATSKALVDAKDLLVVDAAGKKLQGPPDGKAFGEIGLHLTVYQNRPDVRAVVHAHPPAATGLACAGSRLLEQPIIAEAVVSLGPGIPTVPFAAPGAPACAALAPFCRDHDAVLIANHGVMAWGGRAEQAFLRLELVEHLAKIAREAQAAGGLRPIPASAIPALLEARRKAPGLGDAAARAGVSLADRAPAVVACGPAPPDATVTTRPPGAPKQDLATIVREEIVKALR